MATLLAACGIYILTYFTATLAWLFSYRALGIRLRALHALKIILLSQFAKYLPGNVGHHVGRTLLAERYGLTISATVTSMLTDTALVLISGLICSLPSLSFLVSVLSEQHATTAANLLIVSVIAAVAFTACTLALGPLRSRAITVAARFRTLFEGFASVRIILPALALHAFSFVIGAIALWLLCHYFAQTPLALLPAFVGIYSAAWLAGFVIPGAPAGLGVREAMLLAGMSSVMPSDAALMSTALFRVVTITGDGLAFMIGFILPGSTHERQGVEAHDHDEFPG
jgi:uncharacterized membrane protein YbhN (UPF0104 family)